MNEIRHRGAEQAEGGGISQLRQAACSISCSCKSILGAPLPTSRQRIKAITGASQDPARRQLWGRAEDYASQRILAPKPIDAAALDVICQKLLLTLVSLQHELLNPLQTVCFTCTLGIEPANTSA
jgi:hypothetical protein